MRFLPDFVVDFLRKTLPVTLRREMLRSSKYVIDKDVSKAYSVSAFEMGIWINKEKVEDYEAFRTLLVNKLRNLTDPENGENVFEWVKTREEVYHGEYVDKAPDIVFKLKKRYFPSVGFGKKL